MARLRVWERLFCGAVPDLCSLCPDVLCEHPSHPGEAEAYVALRACVALWESARPAVAHLLRVALLYWFSNLGESRSASRVGLMPSRKGFRLLHATGAWLSWDEAVAAMGRKPMDPAAYGAFLERFDGHYAAQWSAAFGSAVSPASVRDFYASRSGNEEALGEILGLSAVNSPSPFAGSSAGIASNWAGPSSDVPMDLGRGGYVRNPSPR
ncbi:MAG: hypothetical protein AB1778_09150 [Candidatus Bipolaricaulota bacterium]